MIFIYVGSHVTSHAQVYVVKKLSIILIIYIYIYIYMEPIKSNHHPNQYPPLDLTEMKSQSFKLLFLNRYYVSYGQFGCQLLTSHHLLPCSPPRSYKIVFSNRRFFALYAIVVSILHVLASASLSNQIKSCFLRLSSCGTTPSSRLLLSHHYRHQLLLSELQRCRAGSLFRMII
ncbi:hypothetical protein Hanom_Chr16g01429811 [Helianthus anomalus]